MLTLIHDRVAAIDPKSARPASMRDRRKVHELLMERSLAEVETILDWAYDNPRWISWLVDGTMVERYFAQVSLDMRTKQAQGPQRSEPTAATPGTRTTRTMMLLAATAVLTKTVPNRTSPNSSPPSTPRSRP